jgi:hypothetical protein
MPDGGCARRPGVVRPGRRNGLFQPNQETSAGRQRRCAKQEGVIATHAKRRGGVFRDHLRIWNRMSSGSYFPPPVRRVDIPKGDTGATRPLEIPTVADRIAQMVAKRRLEPILEPAFHRDSYGYRPGKSVHDALVKARQRCWANDWVLDLDIKSFFDEIDWDLLMRAVRRHTDCPWVLLYLERWLRAPVSMPDGNLVDRESGTPQGLLSVPCWRISFFTMRSISGCNGNIQPSRSNATLTMRSAIARAKRKRLSYVRRWNRGLRRVGYGCTRRRPRSFTVRMPIAPGNNPSDHSTFSATRFGRDRRLVETESALSASALRSAIGLPKGYGWRCGGGDCICAATLSWTKSPNGLAPSSRDGCATMGDFTPRSFARNSARSMLSSCDGWLANTNGSGDTRWRRGTGCVRSSGATRPCSPTGPSDQRLDDGSRMNREVHVRF